MRQLRRLQEVIDTKEIWRRLFGNFVRGDIIRFWTKPSESNIGVYYSHYTLDNEVHLIIAYDWHGGTTCAETVFIPVNLWRKTKIIRSAEENGYSLSRAIKECIKGFETW